MGHWADLPVDLLTLIAKLINLYEDFVAFGGVCKAWRSVAVKENFNPSAGVPWLMLPSSNDVRGFVSVTKGGMVRRVEPPEARGRRCISSKGWLITIDIDDEMELLHPFTRVRIPLPNLEKDKYYTYYKFAITKAALSVSPSVTEDYVLMIIIRRNTVGFWRPGNNTWTVIETQSFYGISDIVYYKDQFYAIHYAGDLHLCNLNSGTSQIVGRIPLNRRVYECYLVDGGSELLVVCRYHWDNDLCFTVFKFEFDPKNTIQYFQEISGGEFGGRSIFLSTEAATVVGAPAAAAGTEPNCIYVADCFANGYHTLYPSSDKDMGMYKWECRTKKRSLDRNTPPIWVLPSF